MDDPSTTQPCVIRHPGVALIDEPVPGERLNNLQTLLPTDVASIGSSLATTMADLHEVNCVLGELEASQVTITASGHAIIMSAHRIRRVEQHDSEARKSDVQSLVRLLKSLTVSLSPEQHSLSSPSKLSRASLRNGLGLPTTPFGRWFGSIHTFHRRYPREAGSNLKAQIDELNRVLRNHAPSAKSGHSGKARTLAADLLAVTSLTGLRRANRSKRPRHWPAIFPMKITAIVACTLTMALAINLALSNQGKSSRQSDNSTIVATPRGTLEAKLTQHVGGVVSVDGVDYQIGASSDRVLLGNWSCTPTKLAILYRPRTRELFSFATWPKGAEEVASRLLAIVPEGGTLATRTEKPNCDRLLVRQGKVERPIHWSDH